MEKNFQELNDQQQQAVYEEHSKICVIAGPGCGKTKTLISRIIYLLTNKNIKPESILVLTFAKKAIKEIKKRISACSTVNNISPQKLYIYNFHSFCFRVLSKHSYLLGFPENKFPVYGRYEQETIISKILCKDGIDAETKEISAIIFFINNWKLGKLNYDDLKSDNSAKKRYKIYQKYEEYLKTNHALDFNDLLLYTASLFKSFPQVREEYQKQFSYFLLDEFQDINSIQWEVIKLILSNEKSIFLVGDPNQTIYGFQGATPDLISSFTRDKSWKTIYLNTNYRSTSNILHLANSFVRRNQPGFIKNLLVSSKSEGLKVNYFYASIRFIVRQIRWLLLREKIQFNDIAILYRNNYLSSRIEQELVAQKIPYEILGSFKFIEREEIKDVLAFLRTIIYQDNLSLLRILSLQEKIGVRAIERIEQKSEKENLSIYKYLDKFVLKQEKLTTGQDEKIGTLILKIDDYKKKLLKQKGFLYNFLIEVLNDFSYWKHLESRNNSLERRKNVQQFLNIVEKWESKHGREFSNLKELTNSFLQWIIIAFEDSKLVKSRDNLILSSVHQAKGLEFEVVFFVYLDRGTLPYKDTQDLLEEKRLFYVGITRPKRLLFLISSKGFYSPFLDEIDEKYLNSKISLQKLCFY